MSLAIRPSLTQGFASGRGAAEAVQAEGATTLTRSSARFATSFFHSIRCKITVTMMSTILSPSAAIATPSEVCVNRLSLILSSSSCWRDCVLMQSLQKAAGCSYVHQSLSLQAEQSVAVASVQQTTSAFSSSHAVPDSAQVHHVRV